MDNLGHQSRVFQKTISIIFFTERNKLDITNFIDVNNFLNKNKINIIINCAAYTDVIEAETNIGWPIE